jgi:long-chain acyl-CoA synthetase
MFNALCFAAGRKTDVLKTLRATISGGSPLSISCFESFKNFFGKEIYQGYGITECSPVVSLNPLKGVNKPNSVGIPYSEIDVKILGEDGKEVATGSEGEVIVKGDIVMKGYYKEEEQTKKFLKEGYFYTGDKGKFDEDGYLYLTGRIKKMVIVGGLNVYYEELKRVLKTHPDIEYVEVFSVEDFMYGEVVGVKVSCKEGSSLTERDVINFCKKRLASYKVPRKVILI